MSEIDERHPVITPRRVKFDWADTPLHWIPGEPVATHFINVLHLLLPAGERWFVHVYKQALPLVEDDERLYREVKGFMGQEAVHAYSHQGVLDRQMLAQGLDPRPLTRRIEWMFKRILGDRPPVPGMSRRRWLKLRIGIIAGIEHYTAVLGQWILDARALDDAGADPTMLDLLRWHGAEEVEHRSVVFDVYKAMGGRYPTRVAAWVVSLFFLYWALIGGSLYLLKQDPTIKKRITPLRVYRAYRRSVRLGHVPGIFRLLLGEAPVYLRPGHHPSKVCSTPQALDYLMRSPAARAAGYDPY